MLHAARQPRSWLIFDVGQKMTSKEHNMMSAILVLMSTGVGGWIIYLQPKEWLATSIAFTLLGCGIWWALKVNRDLVGKVGSLSDVPRDEKWCAGWAGTDQTPNKAPEPTPGSVTPRAIEGASN